MSQMKKEMLALASLSAGRSVVVRPLLKYPDREMARYARLRHHMSLGTQKFLQDERARHRGVADETDADTGVDWRSILAALVATTPKTSMWKGDVVRAVVGATLLDELLSGIDGNIWEIYSRTGCTMDVYPHSDAERQKTNGKEAGYVVLSGDSNAVRQAMSEIRALAQSATLTDTAATLRPLGPDEALKITLTAEGRFTTAYGEKPIHIPALQGGFRATERFEKVVPKPAEWTQRSLVNYIARLAHTHLSQNRTFLLYDTPHNRDESRLELMHQAFTSEDARGAVSLAAFKRAMYSALMSGPHKRPHMRLFFSEMNNLNLLPDTDVFNLFLEDATKHKDLRKFSSVLRMMAKYSCVPNLQSWMQLLRLVEHEEAKQHILRSMHSIGLLYDSRALRSVAREMVFFDAHRAMQGYLPFDAETTTEFIKEKKPPDEMFTDTAQSPLYSGESSGLGESFHEVDSSNLPVFSIQLFLAQLEKHYGPNWASATAIRHIVNVFCLFGRFRSVMNFLAAVGWNHKRDPVLYNIIFSRARTLGRLKPMLQALHIMGQARVLPDEIAYTQIFQLARANYWPNTQAVAWAYACIADRTTMAMRAAAGCSLRFPGCAVNDAFHPIHTRTDYVVPALVPREFGAVFDAASRESVVGSVNRATNRYWFSSGTATTPPPPRADGDGDPAVFDQPIAMRKLGATLVEIFRQEMQRDQPRPLVPTVSFIDALTRAHAWDAKLKVSADDADALRCFAPRHRGPFIEIPLRTKGTAAAVRKLTIPVVRYRIGGSPLCGAKTKPEHRVE
ncbi:hypothetical protein BROUX41_000277 [Berkeleyomyces rouxiae]|uniref:uncharacterized protein n=1 Tax=Berkeleyomyces rouxiae TaxID=2035830 RepID=UPI003B75DDB0